MSLPDRHELDPRRIGGAAGELIVAVAVATGLVAALDDVAPVAGLGVLYLLAVLFVAVRRGQVAALATAVLSFMTFNFFFFDPRYRFTVSESENVVALGVFLIAALVVGRLAALARQRATEAERRALLATARGREAKILANAASSLLTGGDLETELTALGAGSGEDDNPGLRVALTSAPTHESAEIAVRLRRAVRDGSMAGPTRAGTGRASNASPIRSGG